MLTDIELLRAYKLNKDIAARNELVLRYQGAAVNIARKVCIAKYISLEDCVQEAYIGLLSSIEHFDLSRPGMKFWNYAYPWVIGKVIDFIRAERSVNKHIQDNFIDLPSPDDNIKVVELTKTYNKIMNYLTHRCSKDAQEGITYKLSVWNDTNIKGQRNTYYSEVKRAKYNKAIALLSRQFRS